MTQCLKHGHTPEEFWIGQNLYHRCVVCLLTRVAPFEQIRPVPAKRTLSTSIVGFGNNHAFGQFVER